MSVCETPAIAVSSPAAHTGRPSQGEHGRYRHYRHCALQKLLADETILSAGMVTRRKASNRQIA